MPELIVPHSATAAASPWRGSRAYWTCQIAGWSLMFVLNQIGAFTMMPFLWQQLVVNFAVNAFGLGSTHALRALSRTRGWDQLSITRLLPRLALAIIIFVAITLLLFIGGEAALDAVFGRPAAADEGPNLNWKAGIFVVTAVNMSAIYITWCGIYYGVQLVRRQQRDEVERWKLQAALSAAELAALKAQMNPHFLFNALNGVRALVVEDPARARDMVTRLAGILRYSLQASERETVPLSDELKMVDDYLDLEAIRLEERLRVRRDIAPETANVAVPPMVVQTLVENAIKHGISREPAGGNIHLRARLEPETLHVEVANTGALTTGTNGSGTGLRNTAERIHRLWGKAASLHVRESEDGQVVASLRIPR